MDLHRLAAREFERHFATSPPIIVRAPGRVNLIGGHTDYNAGFVLPMAIDRAIWIALQPRHDARVVAHALDFDAAVEFNLQALQHSNQGWAEYLKGVAWSLQQSGRALQGWEGIIVGNVPRGAGLSSSAALELATARAFCCVSGFPWNSVEMARICQRAENEWVGVRCGIMDQLISAAGQAEHALLIDCRSLDITPVPMLSRTSVVIMDTATRRGLAGSLYNERREQCEAAARFFGVPALRQLNLEQLESRANELEDALGPLVRRRARHVVTENARTLQAARAMQRDDPFEMGSLMNASHASLRDDFEVSSHELDVMVACARRDDVCYGARMTGAGFGGCAVALVRADAAAEFSASVAACYTQATGRIPGVYTCAAAPGAQVVVGSCQMH